MPAAYPAVLRDRRGRILAQGRAADISENGVFLLVRTRRTLAGAERLHVELVVPLTASIRNRRQGTRTVRYVCRVVHTRLLGQWVGVGLEFLSKLC